MGFASIEAVFKNQGGALPYDRYSERKSSCYRAIAIVKGLYLHPLPNAP